MGMKAAIKQWRWARAHRRLKRAAVTFHRELLEVERDALKQHAEQLAARQAEHDKEPGVTLADKVLAGDAKVLGVNEHGMTVVAEKVDPPVGQMDQRWREEQDRYWNAENARIDRMFRGMRQQADAEQSIGFGQQVAGGTKRTRVAGSSEDPSDRTGGAEAPQPVLVVSVDCVGWHMPAVSVFEKYADGRMVQVPATVVHERNEVPPTIRDQIAAEGEPCRCGCGRVWTKAELARECCQGGVCTQARCPGDVLVAGPCDDGAVPDQAEIDAVMRAGMCDSVEVLGETVLYRSDGRGGKVYDVPAIVTMVQKSHVDLPLLRAAEEADKVLLAIDADIVVGSEEQARADGYVLKASDGLFVGENPLPIPHDGTVHLRVFTPGEPYRELSVPYDPTGTTPRSWRHRPGSAAAAPF